ncbi:O-antigen ligase family protein [Zunongwangia sp. HRR-M8]|uniref:O-antigen ligase family protein n=1 Tax=Zunongwangia sp. HRR-M8 TaxID=3015170 RepID=UPI0022DD9344|nr:O-antigen ligase family protein [Zunongwangia sp. HRR-M8]WBL22047.1 O-antigen ligase family protein [Zunongwangia sp. HRR-M8]
MRTKAYYYATKILPFCILLVTLSSVNQWSRLPIGNTFFWWIIYGIILVLFFKTKSYLLNSITSSFWPISFFLIIVLFSFMHGILKSEYYWDWKLLISNLMVFLMPISVYAFGSPLILSKIIKYWKNCAFPLFPIFLMFILPEAYGRYLMPISFFLLFFPILPKKWKFIGILSILLITLLSSGARSNVIKFIVPFGLSFLYYFRNFFSKKIFFLISLMFFVLPFAFFYLAANNTFNVFKFDEYLDTKNDDQKLLVDTRTFLYEEVISSAINNDYWFLGRSMARGFDSNFFDWLEAYKQYRLETDRDERQSSEVSILNIFNYFGIVGVIAYFIIFFKAVHTSIYMSNNIFSKILGVYVAFRWFYSWIEDFSRFDLNFLVLWIAVGVCFSETFRSMNDKDFFNWIQSLFSKSALLS